MSAVSLGSTEEAPSLHLDAPSEYESREYPRPVQPILPLSQRSQSSTENPHVNLLQDFAETQVVASTSPVRARQDKISTDRDISISALPAEPVIAVKALPHKILPDSSGTAHATVFPQSEVESSSSRSEAQPSQNEARTLLLLTDAPLPPTQSVPTVPDPLRDIAGAVQRPSAPETTTIRSTGDVDTSEDVDLSTMGAGESIQASQLVPLAHLNPDGTSGDIIAEPGLLAARITKRRRIDAVDDDIRPTIEIEIHKRRRVQGIARNARRPKGQDGPRKRRKRAETPEDAEDQEVDRATMKMADLCKDIKIGRKFSKHAELKQREIEQKLKARLTKENPELMTIEENRISSNPTNVQEMVEDPSGGVQMRLVNGQIVVDDRTLVVDRHARAAATAEVMEEIEENEFTRITTSGTHMKRERAIIWNWEAEEKFYDGLRMFGTDFEMISHMFPDRSRRQIKLKFNKEEKAYPEKVNKALIGEKVSIDLEEYKAHTGLEYEDTKTITDEYQKIEEEHAAEEAEQEARAAEEVRKKKAAIQGTSDNRGKGADSAKENEPDRQDGKASAASKSRKKGIGKKKRNLHSVHGGGEDIEVLGTI